MGFSVNKKLERLATMVHLLRRNRVSLINLFPSYRRHNPRILTPHLRFSTQTQQRKEDVPFIAQYLISSFGFSEERALKVATNGHLSPIKTPDRPESVVRFLKDTGLTDVQIKKAIYLAPQLLSASVSKTLERAANDVIVAGFTRETLVELIRFNPQVLIHNNIVSRLQFWRNLVGSEEAFLKFTKKWGVFSLNIDKKVIPQINLLREYGLSDKHMAILLLKPGNFLLQSPDSMKSNIEQIEKLGFPRGSKMVLEGLAVVSSMKKDTLEKKMTFLKTAYGWSQEDINSAFKKFPRALTYSQEKVSSTMDFLIMKVGLNPRSVASWPRLLGYSLERRLIPRHSVLTVLKSKGLRNKCSFPYVIDITEKQFLEDFILKYKEELPDLEEAYVAARAGRRPL